MLCSFFFIPATDASVGEFADAAGFKDCLKMKDAMCNRFKVICKVFAAGLASARANRVLKNVGTKKRSGD